MSYETFLAQPNSQKQTLIEIDIGESIAIFNQEPGIWATQYVINTGSRSFGYGSGCFGFGAYGTGGTAVLSNGKTRSKVGSLWVDGEHLTRRTSLANVRANERSFYFDFDNQLLYVGLDDFNPPQAFDFIQAGITEGYSNRAAYWDGLYYDARLLGLPVVAKRKDPLFWGLLAFEGGSIELANADGHFDTFASRNIFGQQCRVLFGSPDLPYASAAAAFTGYVEDFQLEGGRISIAIQDKRKGLSRTLPIHQFDATTYPNIEDNNIGAGIPIAYGQIRNAPAICTNEKLTLAGSTGLYYFKLADTSYHPIYALTTVRCEGSSGTVAACAAGNVNLNAATFSLNAEQYEPGRDVTVDFSGYANAGGVLLENGLDIIADLMAWLAGVSYDAVNYDTTEWAAEQASAETMCFYVDEEQELVDAIADLCASVPGIFLVQDDDLYTFKRFDADKAVDRTIRAEELLGPPTLTNESDEFLTSVLVKYSKDWAKDKWKSYVDATREAAGYRQYKRRQQQTFETMLTGGTAAAAFASIILDQHDAIVPTYRILTKTQNIDLELEDVVDAELYVFANAIPFCDRGDCESATPPMVTGETVPVLFNATFTRDVAVAYGGASSYKLTKAVAAGTGGYVCLTDNELTTDLHGFLPGQTVTKRYWLKIPSGGILGSEIFISIRDYAGAWVETAQLAQNIYDAWQAITVTRTLRANCTGMTVRLQVVSSAALNEYFNVDEIEIDVDSTYGAVRCEVVGIEKNLMEYTVALTLRYIEDVTAGLSAATLIKWEA